jgi:alanyl-tRNA synthetase
MLSDKDLKKKFLLEFQKNPEKYYPRLDELGLVRKRCSCGKFFWSVKSETCGSPECIGGYKFIGKTPAKRKVSYINLWNEFSRILKKSGYIPIKKYPVVARWRDDIEFVEASIDDFIPYVINGEVEPPANPLIVPQPCLRFNDLDNVGITGAHYSCFVMIGQHRFEKPEKYDMYQYLLDLLKWFTGGLKIPMEDIILHEDVWAGSGNFGPCIEFFSSGLELANQVYMQFMQTESGFKDLSLKVLDMGLGYERNAWFSSGLENSYETTFPTVIKRLKKITGIELDKAMMSKFIPFSSYLNIDEIADAEKTWQDVARRIGYDITELKEAVLKSSALYSIVEHSRSLLFAISDGALPSNVGGGYNLRVILRRMLSFIDKYGWNIDISKLCELHSAYLKPLFPELKENLEDIKKILDIEESRYRKTKEKSMEIVKRAVEKEIGKEELLKLYDSNGIVPDVIKEEAMKVGKEIKIPENFYAEVAALHKPELKSEKKLQINVAKLMPTKILFHEDENKTYFSANVLKIIGNKYVILDRTYFYPRSGGEEPDNGFINGCRVYDVEKIGKVVVHSVEKLNFREGSYVDCVIDWQRREQLTRHHTAVHIINSSARRILGNHVWQHSAYKDSDKARLDITHYEALSDKEIDKIENLANSIVEKSIPIIKTLIPRNEAEKKFGFRIYQGGAVPERQLRIVEIPGVDVEACGGTHLNNTKDAGQILITSTERIQDGIDRINIIAGDASKKYLEERKELLSQIENILEARGNDTIKAAKKLFNEWKKSIKKMKGKTESVARVTARNLEKRFVNNVLIEKLDANMDELQEISRILSNDERIIILFGIDEKIHVFGSAGSKTGIDIGKIISSACSELGGKGGGSPNLGQGIGLEKEKLNDLISKLKGELHGR